MTRDIGVSMSAEILLHKQEDGRRSQSRYCYWRMGRIPEGVERGSRLWGASGGGWRGYFVLDGVDHFAEGGDASVRELVFVSESWVERDGGPRSPFQGYTLRIPEPRT